MKMFSREEEFSVGEKGVEILRKKKSGKKTEYIAMKIVTRRETIGRANQSHFNFGGNFFTFFGTNTSVGPIHKKVLLQRF